MSSVHLHFVILLLDTGFLVYSFFLWGLCYPCLLASITSSEILTVNHEVPLYMMHNFSLSAFKVFFCLWSQHFYYDVPVGLFVFIFFGVHLASLCIYPLWSSFSMFFNAFGMFSAIICLNIFSSPFSLPSFWHSHYMHVGALNGTSHFSEAWYIFLCYFSSIFFG